MLDGINNTDSSDSEAEEEWPFLRRIPVERIVSVPRSQPLNGQHIHIPEDRFNIDLTTEHSVI